MEKLNTETAYQREKSNKLMLSIAMDAIGMATFLLPGLAEFADVAWAPIAALVNFLMFRGMTGLAGGAGTFLEEFLPGTDWIPSFTMTWGIKYILRENDTIAEFTKRHQERKTLFSR